MRLTKLDYKPSDLSLQQGGVVVQRELDKRYTMPSNCFPKRIFIVDEGPRETGANDWSQILQEYD